VSLVSPRNQNHLVDRVRQFMGGQPCRLQIAALPWRKGPEGIEVMLITSRDTGRWVLPKGWPEANEVLCEAAAREAAEEAGISGTVATSEIGTFHYGKRRASGADTPCEVRVFAMEIDRVADKWPERKQRRRQWFAPEEASAAVAEADLGALIARFCASARRVAV